MQFPEVTMRPGTKTLTIRRNAKRPALNGRPLDGFKLRHADIVRGGVLELP